MRDPETYFYLVVELPLCNNNVLSVQSEINTEPHLPWEYLSEFLNEYSLEFSCSSVLLGPSWLEVGSWVSAFWALLAMSEMLEMSQKKDPPLIVSAAFEIVDMVRNLLLTPVL